MTSRSNVCGEPMSTWNQCPGACPVPLVQRDAGLPSIACPSPPEVGEAVTRQPARGSGPPGSGGAPGAANLIQLRFAMPLTAVSGGSPRNTRYKLWMPLTPLIGAVSVVQLSQPPVPAIWTLLTSGPFGASTRNSRVPPDEWLATRTLTDSAPYPKSTRVQAGWSPSSV